MGGGGDPRQPDEQRGHVHPLHLHRLAGEDEVDDRGTFLGGGDVARAFQSLQRCVETFLGVGMGDQPDAGARDVFRATGVKAASRRRLAQHGLDLAERARRAGLARCHAQGIHQSSQSRPSATSTKVGAPP